MFKFTTPVSVNPGSASRFVGQGPQQGNARFSETHSSTEVQDAALPGVDDFATHSTAMRSTTLHAGR